MRCPASCLSAETLYRSCRLQREQVDLPIVNSETFNFAIQQWRADGVSFQRALAIVFSMSVRRMPQFRRHFIMQILDHLYIWRNSSKAAKTEKIRDSNMNHSIRFFLNAINSFIECMFYFTTSIHRHLTSKQFSKQHALI